MDDEAILSEIKMFVGTYAPRGWMWCEGQVLPIQSNTALYSLLGDRYGGDGVSTFALPDMRGRVPIGAGNGPGLTPREPGQRGGSETVHLTITSMPQHSHSASFNLDVGWSASTANGTAHLPPAGSTLATPIFDGPSKRHFIEAYADDVDPATDTIVELGGTSANATFLLAPTGTDARHQNMQPSVTIGYIIATEGTYPPRGD